MKTSEEMKAEMLERAKYSITLRMQSKQRLKALLIIGSITITALIAELVITLFEISLEKWIAIGIMFVAAFSMCLIFIIFYPGKEFILPKIKISDKDVSDEYQKIILCDIERIPKWREEIEDKIIKLQQSHKEEVIKLQDRFKSLGEDYETLNKLKATI